MREVEAEGLAGCSSARGEGLGGQSTERCSGELTSVQEGFPGVVEGSEDVLGVVRVSPQLLPMR